MLGWSCPSRLLLWQKDLDLLLNYQSVRGSGMVSVMSSPRRWLFGLLKDWEKLHRTRGGSRLLQLWLLLWLCCDFEEIPRSHSYPGEWWCSPSDKHNCQLHSWCWSSTKQDQSRGPSTQPESRGRHSHRDWLWRYPPCTQYCSSPPPVWYRRCSPGWRDGFLQQSCNSPEFPSLRWTTEYSLTSVSTQLYTRSDCHRNVVTGIKNTCVFPD